MEEYHAKLSRQLVKSSHWKWTPGMLVVWPNGNEFRVAQVNSVDGVNDLPNYPAGGWGDDYPDLTRGHPHLEDPATVGCLLDLARRRISNPEWRPYPVNHDPGPAAWVVQRPSNVRQTLHPSEVSAIAHVLMVSSDLLETFSD